MDSKDKSRNLKQVGFIGPDKLSEEFLHDFSSRLIKLLTTDKDLQKRYEQDTGKKFHK